MIRPAVVSIEVRPLPSRTFAAVPVALLLTIAWLAAAPDPAGATEAPAPLFPVVKNGKWGYIDRTGRLAIPPTFDRAERFSEGLASVRLGATLGFVDATGRMALVPAFAPDGVVHRRFSEGLAAVRQGGRIGFIDRSGKLVVPAAFLTAEDFSEGFAFVCDEKGCGFVDAKGTYALAPDAMGGTSFRNGVATVVLGMGMSTKRISFFTPERGRFPEEYEDAGSFAEGLAPVRIARAWGYVDEAGTPVIANRFASAAEFSEGLAAVEILESGRCGYVDRTGKLAVAARFRTCGPFRGRLARVDLAERSTDADHVAFIDRAGAVVIDGRALDPPIHGASEFEDGLAAVGVGGPPDGAGAGAVRLGYVDAKGRWVWRPTY